NEKPNETTVLAAFDGLVIIAVVIVLFGFRSLPKQMRQHHLPRATTAQHTGSDEEPDETVVITAFDGLVVIAIVLALVGVGVGAGPFTQQVSEQHLLRAPAA